MSVEVQASALDRLIGQTLADRYLVEERLGEGAMGAVYRARHIKVGRPFAVKVLHPRLLEDKKLVQRFEREAELAGRLRHPNVIGVVDVGQTPDGLHYMVMDFAAGPDLASLLDEAPMPAPRVIHLTRQLLEGLYHAHEAGLIHRDFKPENVIVERDTHGSEVPRIVDFGIAILRDGGDDPGGPGRLTTNGLVLGTPHYMAPEQAVADALDHRTDLFALGILVYELLSGVLPFDGSGVEVARANLLLDPPPIGDRVPGLAVDPLLEAFARRLMAKKASDRPATAKAARELLDLIEKDRDAAAKALGVTAAPAPQDSVRAPMTTQPSQPVRRESSAEGTFPPPLSDAAHREAPPAATKSPPPRSYASTVSAEPLAPAKRRGPLIGAVLAGVVVIGGATVAILSSGGTKDSSTRTPVATAPEPAPTPAPTPAPIAEPPPTEAPPPSDTPAEMPPADTKQPPTSPAPATTAKRPVKAATSPTRPSESKPAETAPAEVRAVESRPAATTSPATPAATSAVTASSLAAQYKSVGEQLAVARAGASTDELRQRYRYIKLPEAMRTQESRDAAMAILKKISAELARQR